MKIVVLAGGASPEREVSLSSGAMITNALMERGYEVFLLDSLIGVGEEEEISFKCREDGVSFSHEIGRKAPELKIQKEKNQGYLGRRVLEICGLADVVFLALHGGAGEDGQIQAVLNAAGIPYTGSDYDGCLKAMDKHVSKLLMRAAEIPTPDWRVYEKGEEIEAFALPCVVKPCGGGSSVGVTMAENQKQWTEAISKAFAYESRIMAEEKITGREFSVGILGDRTLPAIEIVPKSGFYDYENKYQAGMADEICPAELEEETAGRLGELALKVHKVLGLGYYSRIDFLMREDGKIYCLEANTLPGMTPLSLLPQEAKAAGISYGQLCELIATHKKGEK